MASNRWINYRLGFFEGRRPFNDGTARPDNKQLQTVDNPSILERVRSQFSKLNFHPRIQLGVVSELPQGQRGRRQQHRREGNSF